MSGSYFYFGGKKVYVVEEMPKRTYDSSLFQVNENGFLTYDSDKYTSKIGIDVSRYQGSIDWAAVKDAGVEFAMLRLGYRGYGTGAIVRDSYFYQNIQGALENGIEVGVYFFSQDGAAEAVNVIKEAINSVSMTRGTLGATQNRLEHTQNNLSVMEENITDAESTIRDTDVAEEMMSYTKNNILIQSAQAMLAQANQVPQGVLQLLQ